MKNCNNECITTSTAKVSVKGINAVTQKSTFHTPLKFKKYVRDAKASFNFALISLHEKKIEDAIEFFTDATIKGDLMAIKYLRFLIKYKKANVKEQNFWMEIVLAAERKLCSDIEGLN